MSNATLINTKVVNEYPLSHIARENQQTIIEHANTLTGSFIKCKEMFRYFHEIPYTEQLFNHNFSGYCLVTIHIMPNGQYMVDREAEYPDYLRKQHNYTELFATYSEAREEALKQINYIEEWLYSKWYEAQPVVNMSHEDWEEHKQYMKKEYEDGVKVIRLVGDHNKAKFNIDCSIKENAQTEYFRVNIID